MRTSYVRLKVPSIGSVCPKEDTPSEPRSTFANLKACRQIPARLASTRDKGETSADPAGLHHVRHGSRDHRACEAC